MSSVAESQTPPTSQTWSVWHIDPRHTLSEFSVRHRPDFALSWNMALQAGGFLVGDHAAIEIEPEAVKAGPAAAGDPR